MTVGAWPCAEGRERRAVGGGPWAEGRHETGVVRDMGALRRVWRLSTGERRGSNETRVWRDVGAMRSVGRDEGEIERGDMSVS